jgi:Na+-transporting NADH:ubiquinone oxidoreductase subunit A
MRLKGGYNIQLAGRPAGTIQKMPEPQVLYLPLCSRRFAFSQLCVEDNQPVKEGDVLARDPANYRIGLLAPRAGTARTTAVEGHVVLDNIVRPQIEPGAGALEPSHVVGRRQTPQEKRQRLVDLGAWQFFYEARTEALPDPFGSPQAVVVSTVSLEPYLVRGDVLLRDQLLHFTRGLEHIQSLLEYQPIYLIMPDIRSAFADQVRQQIRGYAWVKMLDIPLVYPCDNFSILVRKLGIKSGDGSVWSIRTEGVMAVDRALTFGEPCTRRVVSVGGPAVDSPAHIEVPTGYPLQMIRDEYAKGANVRIINGGILTGQAVTAGTLGIDSECTGLTMLPELEQRELFGFARPGWDRTSYANCFLSSLWAGGSESLTTGVRGEPRPCISCGFCEDACPAGIMPHLIHKYLYADLIDQAEQARLDLCVECGLCSFVCPSKIELTKQFIDAKELIEQEKAEIRQQELESVEDSRQ